MQILKQITDEELRVGVAYAQQEYGVVCLDQDLIRTFANAALAEHNRTPKIGLAFIAAKLVREKIRARTKAEDQRAQAYKGAVMKIFSDRSAWKRRRELPPAEKTPDPVIGHEKYRADSKGQFQLL